MAIYTVHLPPDAVEPLAVAERSVFVKEGFAFFGFAFTGLWLLAERLWLQALAYFGALAAVSALFWRFGLPPGAFAGVTFLLAVLIGVEGNEWIRRRFAKRGWSQAGTVSGPSLDECERRFFQDWIGAQAVPRQAPSPVPSAAQQPPPGVLGVFPTAGGRTGPA